jgi:hypothetical protein
VVWAERNGCAILLLSPVGRRVSRLLTGSCCDVEEHAWATRRDIEGAIQAFLALRSSRRSAHVHMRERREPELSPTLQNIRSIVEATDHARFVDTTNWLSKDRIDEILSSVDQLDNASLTELRQIALLTGTPLAELVDPGMGERPTIDVRAFEDAEFVALAQAAELEEWGPEILARVLTKALRLQDTRYVRRAGLRDAESWIELLRE